MNVGLTDPKACKATRAWTEDAIAAPNDTWGPGKSVVIEWRRDTTPARW
jgi:hypothetical protein